MQAARLRFVFAAIATFLALTVPVAAESATIAVSDPTGNGVVTVTVTRPDGTVDTIPISVTHVMSAKEKRDQIAVNLLVRGYDAAASGPRRVTIDGLEEGTVVSVDAGATGERIDRLVADAARDARIRFAGLFDPIAADGAPCEFTAGFVAGESSILAQVTAEELGFATDGANVALALFERLVGAADSLGVGLELVDDALWITFPDGQADPRAGVVFGTTSLSPGASGELTVHQATEADGGLQPQVETAQPFDRHRSDIEFTSGASGDYCVYFIVSSTCPQLEAGDFVCVNCPDSRCSNTIAFKVVNGDDDCRGRWSNAHGTDTRCKNCPANGKRGWRFAD